MATAEENAAARAQIAAQQELGRTAPMDDAAPGELGQQVASSGAGATDVDVQALLAQLRELQGRVQSVEDERAAEKVQGLPDVVVRAEQILADLTHRHGALSAGSPLGDIVDRAGALVEAARGAVESGDSGELLTLAGALGKRLARVASAAASADISFARQLVDEDLPEAAAAIRPARQPGAQDAPRAAPSGQQGAPARPGRTITF